MIKTFRINQKIIEGGQITTFDINLEENKINDFIKMLDGKITVWQKIVDNEGKYKEKIPNKYVKEFKIKFEKYTVNIKGYKGKIYFKDDHETVANFIKENTACLIENKKPKNITYNTSYSYN